MDKYPMIGMGGDNSAFASFLGGCNSNCTYNELKNTYNKVDIGFDSITRRENKKIKENLKNANLVIYKQMIDSNILPYIFPLPQVEFNAYTIEEAKFIAHFAGGKNKEHELRSAFENMSLL